ncbi:ABC transporter permease [Burkholderia plantarii]|uniref:ABC transporter permease n=1 Tax=Burkholderia plantarii TaxID=41899 RepID=UPI000A4C5096|nr:ABC transporter permease [Burkholderia plantarii]
MNWLIDFLLAPAAMYRIIKRNRALIHGLIQREISSRYRGSMLGILWSVLNPLLMLGVYAFVFTVVFKPKWAQASPKSEFVMAMYAGIIVFNFFSECVNRAPGLILANVNYVKKVVFPLEILPVVTLGSAAFQLAINLVIWLVFYIAWFGAPGLSILLLPVVLLPLFAMTLGISWLLAALGVYLRDISQVIGIAVMMLMHLSPVFYPLSMVPARFRTILSFGPLTLAVEQARDAMMWSRGPDWMAWFEYLLVALIVAALGFFWFEKTKKGFSDVL